jgi:hypothetical protein
MFRVNSCSHPVRRALRRLAPAGLLLVALAAGSALGQTRPTETIDSGTYRISVQGQPIGTELFYIELMGDTIVVSSSVRHAVRTATGPESLLKSVVLYVNKFDLDLRFFQSNERFAGTTKTRGLVLADTAYTAYWEMDGFGEGTRFERPPGRLYVHDPQVFALFDLIGRDLNFQTFDQRPILLYVLGARDTTVEVTATKLGTEKLTWGGGTFDVNRLSLKDPNSELLLWVDHRGRMIRLSQPSSGLEVLREPPPKASGRKPRG